MAMHMQQTRQARSAPPLHPQVLWLPHPSYPPCLAAASKPAAYGISDAGLEGSARYLRLISSLLALGGLPSNTYLHQQASGMVPRAVTVLKQSQGNMTLWHPCNL